MTEDSDWSSVPPPGEAMIITGAGVAPPPGAAITIVGGALVGALVALPPPPPTAGVGDTVPVSVPGEGWVVVTAGAVGAAVIGSAVVAASIGEADGFRLTTGAGATVAALIGEGDGTPVGLPVDSSTGCDVGTAGEVGLCVRRTGETGDGVVTAGATVVAAAPPVEIGSDTASAYDWGPSWTSPSAADTRTVQVPAVTSEAGTTTRSTLLRRSREHVESPPLHFPHLSTTVAVPARGRVDASGRVGGRGGVGGGGWVSTYKKYIYFLEYLNIQIPPYYQGVMFVHWTYHTHRTQHTHCHQKFVALTLFVWVGCHAIY